MCNKYFLKSHLQNKHGVQLDDYIAMYFPNAISSLGATTTTTTATTPSAGTSSPATSSSSSSSSQPSSSSTMTPEQQQAAALVAAAVANELIENHAQSLNLSTLNQVVAAKLITNSANRLATTTGSASPSPDPYAKAKILSNGGNGSIKTAAVATPPPPIHRNSPLVNQSNGLYRKSLGLDHVPNHHHHQHLHHLNGYA